MKSGMISSHCHAQRAHEKKEAEVVTDADLDTIVQKLLGPPEHVSGALRSTEGHLSASLAPICRKATLSEAGTIDVARAIR